MRKSPLYLLFVTAGSTRSTALTYADALAKGHDVSLLVVEPLSGAMSPALARLLHDLDALTKLPGGIDSTIYGTSRRATRSFKTHHAAAIAHATVRADAAVLAIKAAVRVSVAPSPAPHARRGAPWR